MFSVEREVSDPRGGAALVGLLHPGVRQNESPIVKDRMADQPIKEIAGLLAELVALCLELLERLREPVGDLDISSFELPCELDVVVPGQADRRAGCRHAHDQPQDRRGAGPRSP